MKSLSKRFSFAVISVSVVVLLCIIAINFFFIKQQLLQYADTKAKLEIFKSEDKINKILFRALNDSSTAKDLLQTQGLGIKTIKNILSATLQKNPNIYGMAVAMEPGVIYKKPFCPYYYKNKNKIIYVNLATEKYNYLAQPWYLNVKNSTIAQWSEPYFDKGGGETLMATYSNPLFYKNRFAGVVTFDLALDKLAKIVSSIHILKSGYAFLLSKKHTVLVHPDKNMIMKKYYRKNIVFDRFIKKNGNWIYYTKINFTGWILGIVLPQKELFAPLYTITVISAVLAVLGIILLFTVITVISRNIIRPLKNVIAKSVDISNGDFDTEIEMPKIKDEIYLLSRSVNRMQEKIKNYIENITQITKEEEKRKSELNIASKIQMNMLPEAGHFHSSEKIEVLASLKPAKEVGGDFFDFFYLDENRCCFTVADVSGKGVPAALFMAVTISYIRAYASKELTPAEIIQKVNNAICLKNNTGMFVTVFLAVYDFKTKKLSYINAGHPSPYLLKDGKVQKLPYNNDPVIGAMENIEYKNYEISVNSGDKLFIFTDGVNEAFSINDEQFGFERIENLLRNLQNENIQTITDKIKKQIETFTTGAQQSDDITVMLIEIK